jgi:L-threonylcarbamoyladenylate synthase
MSDSPLLRRAVRVLRQGGVIAYPTEAVYGLGCDPSSRQAVERILTIKGRPVKVGFILIGASLAQFTGWIALRPGERERLRSPAVKPVTWVVTAGPKARRWLTGGRRSIAVRVTAHPVAAALCRAFSGPLVSTSANRHGRPPARSALASRRSLGRELDLVLPGPTGGLRKPTEIRDARTGAVIRRG